MKKDLCDQSIGPILTFTAGRLQKIDKRTFKKGRSTEQEFVVRYFNWHSEYMECCGGLA